MTHALGLVADGFRPPHRNELDDLDTKTWEIGERRHASGSVAADDVAGVRIGWGRRMTIFTFAQSTTGGQSAIAALCEAHGRTTEDVGQYPVVDARRRTPTSTRIKSYGTGNVPVFKIVDSVDAAPFDAIVAEERGGAAFMPANGSASMQIGSSAFGGPPHRRRSPRRQKDRQRRKVSTRSATKPRSETEKRRGPRREWWRGPHIQ